MSNIIKVAREEIIRLERMLKKIDAFLSRAPEGCLKWQNKKGKTYYYHQYMMNNEIKEDKLKGNRITIKVLNESDLQDHEEKKDYDKWERKYIKKKDISLAKALAQKQYYVTIRTIIVKRIKALKTFIYDYGQEAVSGVYDNLSSERKALVIPFEVSIKECLKQWKDEVYEKNSAYPENLRYETQQGELVRSKSEVIIANILYQYRKDILYKYERPLNVMADGKMKTIYPDFTILNVHTGRDIYWEHAGRMDDSHYANEFVKKMNTYITNDLLPGRDVIVSFESQGNSLDISVVKRLVKELILVE